MSTYWGWNGFADNFLSGGTTTKKTTSTPTMGNWNFVPWHGYQGPSKPSGGGSGGSGGGSGGSNPPPPITVPPVANQNALQLFEAILQGYGLNLGPDIMAILKQAMIDGQTDLTALMPQIEQTASFKARFPGFAQRTANGYNQISVADYLNLENSYHRILQSAGLPAGFYDQPSDFGSWIANDVSPQEIQSRVDLAVGAANQVDPTARGLLTKFYGVTTGDLASYFLDQSRALPILDRQYKAANVAAFAVENGLTLQDASHYENLVDKGITPDQAAIGYGTVASFAKTLGELGGIYGTPYSQNDAENDVFFNQTDKRRRIVADEVATFSGRSQGSLGTAQRGTSY